MIHDHDTNRVILKNTKESVPLERGHNDHHLLELFNFRGEVRREEPATAAQVDATVGQERTVSANEASSIPQKHHKTFRIVEGRTTEFL